MGIDISSKLMIGMMFDSGNDESIDINIYDIADEYDLDIGGDHMSNGYLCIGKRLSSVDEYSEFYNKINVDHYDHIKEFVGLALQKALPNHKINVGMYHIVDVS